MEIKLTDEQYQKLKEERTLDIEGNNNKFHLYIEYSENLDLDYIESYHTDKPVYTRRDYAVSKEELELLKPKKPIDPSWHHNYPLCPNCGTYMIYYFENCPKCGQHIDWSGFVESK